MASVEQKGEEISSRNPATHPEISSSKSVYLVGTVAYNIYDDMFKIRI